MPGIYLRPTDRLTDRPPDILPQPLPSSFPAKPAFSVAAEAAGGIEDIGAVDPERPGLDLGRDVQSEIDVLGPHAGRETIPGIVGQLDRLLRGSEGHQYDHRTEDLDLGNGRCRRYVGEQGRRVEPAILRAAPGRL